MMNHLTLNLFGAFQVTLNQQPIVAFESNKARALLAYLAVESAQAHTRPTLAGLFWPEIREENARDSLRHSLTNLRKLLLNDKANPPFLLIDRQSVQFNTHSHHRLDVAEFAYGIGHNHNPSSTEEATTSPIARLEQAVALYRGAFLNGFFLNDCSAFEEWLLLTRERLHTQMVSALAALMDHFEAQQEFEQAEHYARRLLSVDNLQEDAHCSLMRILARRGQRSAALSQYEQCRQLLADALGVSPRAETVVLHQQIQQGGWGSKRISPSKFTPALSQIPAVAPKPQSAPSSPPQHNLPAATTSFVGRTRQVAEICHLLHQPAVRLLTLHGTGGVGKTRLVLQAARQLVADFADGCAWVELAPLQAATQIPLAIAQSLGVQISTGSDPLQQVKNYLRQRHVLLVLDNYEHLLDAAPLVTELLRHAEHLKCLVTSREPLHLQGEQEYPVPALAVPTPQELTESLHLTEYAAIQLFIQRSQAVKPDLAIDPNSTRAMAQICMRLDGLPLAIELAAARSKFFTPQALLQKLEASSLSFLRTSARDVPTRHQTLRHVIAWSYQLLKPEEQQILRRLAIFVGGCSLPAAEAVCLLDEEEHTLDLLEILHSLVDKNLVRQGDGAEGEPRFWLLETIREFGLEQLADSGELSMLQQQHVNYYRTFADAWCLKLMSAEMPQALWQLRTEYPNLHTALQWLLSQRAVVQSLRLCNMLLHYWAQVGGKESIDYLEAVLKLADDAPPTVEYINALANAGYASFILSNQGTGQNYFEKCLALNKTMGNVGDPVKIGMANGLLGWILFDQGDYQAARAYLAAAKENDIAMGADWALAMTIINQGKMEAKLGEFEDAHSLLEDAFTRQQHLGDLSKMAITRLHQSMAYILQGKFTEAVGPLEEGRKLYLQLHLEGAQPDIYRCAALIALHAGEENRAQQAIRETLLIAEKLNVPRSVLEILEAAIQVAVGFNEPYKGLVLASAIAAYRQQHKQVAPPIEKRLVDDAVAMARQQLAQDVAISAWRTGERMTLDEAIHYALCESELA